MKILHLNTFGNGSTGKIAASLIEEAYMRGEDAMLIYARGVASDKIKSEKIGNKLEIYLHGAFSRITDKQGFYSKNATSQLIEIIRFYKPDVVHLHNIHGYYLNIGMLFCYLKKTEMPVIWTLHDCWSFTGHCSYFDYVSCEKWKKQCYKCIQKKSYPASYLRDNSYANYKVKKDLFTSIKNLYIVVPSNWLKKHVEASFLNVHKSFLIYNGIDLDTFNFQSGNFRTKYKLQDKFIILGVASKWEDRKNLAAFIDLSQRLDNSYKIVIVGVTKKQLQMLPKQILGIRRTEKVQELVSIYSQADIFLNPTLEDNFPTVNLEALACGTPVITYNTGGSGEMLDEKTGIVIEDNSVEAIMQAVKKLREKNLFSEACIRRASLFSKDKMMEQYMELYRKIVKNVGKE